MAKVNIKDFFLKLGFDGKEVDKGLDDLEKKVQRFSKSFVGINKQQDLAARRQTEIARSKLKSEERAARSRSATTGALLTPDRNTLKDARERQAFLNRQNILLDKSADKLEKLRIKWGSNREEIIKTAKATGLTNKQAEKLAQSVGVLDKELQGIRNKAAVAKTTQDLKNLNRQTDKTAKATTNLTLRQRILAKDLSVTQQAMVGLTRATKRNAAAFAVMVASFGGAAFLRTGQELQALQASMLGASGGAEQAAKDFEFVKQVSRDLGVDLTEASRGYSKIGAAAIASGLDAEQSRKLFLGASEIATAFSLTGEESAGIQRAFTQILSKGKVSTEELLQIGERIPGTMARAAESLGMGTQEMLKLIESGQLMANDFLPGFVDTMSESIRKTGQLTEGLKTSRVAMNKFATEFKIGIDEAFKAGAESGLASFFLDMRDAMKDLMPLIRTFGRLLGGTLKILGKIVNFVTTIISPVLELLDAIVGFVLSPFGLESGVGTAGAAAGNTSSSSSKTVNNFNEFTFEGAGTDQVQNVVRDTLNDEFTAAMSFGV